MASGAYQGKWIRRRRVLLVGSMRATDFNPSPSALRGDTGIAGNSQGLKLLPRNGITCLASTPSIESVKAA